MIRMIKTGINAASFSGALIFGSMVQVAAFGATIVSYDRATFQNALADGSASGQDFDALFAGSIIGTVDGVTYSTSLGAPLVTSSFLTTTPFNGLGSTSIGYFLAGETATFSFASPITAFAIDINTFAPIEGSYRAVLDIGDVALSTFDVFPGRATGQFIGFTSSVAFSSLTISTNTAYSYTLDTLVYGDARRIVDPPSVPDSSTSAILLVLGLLAIQAARVAPPLRAS